MMATSTCDEAETGKIKDWWGRVKSTSPEKRPIQAPGNTCKVQSSSSFVERLIPVSLPQYILFRFPFFLSTSFAPRQWRLPCPRRECTQHHHLVLTFFSPQIVCPLVHSCLSLCVSMRASRTDLTTHTPWLKFVSVLSQASLVKHSSSPTFHAPSLLHTFRYFDPHFPTAPGSSPPTATPPRSVPTSLFPESVTPPGRLWSGSMVDSNLVTVPGLKLIRSVVVWIFLTETVHNCCEGQERTDIRV